MDCRSKSFGAFTIVLYAHNDCTYMMLLMFSVANDIPVGQLSVCWD